MDQPGHDLGLTRGVLSLPLARRMGRPVRLRRKVRLPGLQTVACRYWRTQHAAGRALRTKAPLGEALMQLCSSPPFFRACGFPARSSCWHRSTPWPHRRRRRLRQSPPSTVSASCRAPPSSRPMPRRWPYRSAGRWASCCGRDRLGVRPNHGLTRGAGFGVLIGIADRSVSV